jgi:hypothetical protein
VRCAPADQPLKTTAPGCRVRNRWRPVRAISPGRFRSMPLRAQANYRGWRPTIHVGHSLDQHGKDVARIALPIAAMDRDQTGRRCVAGRIETNLGSFAIPVWNIQSGGAPCPQSRRSLVAQWPFGRGRTVGPPKVPRDLKKLATPQRDENSRIHFTKKRCLFDNLLCIAID